MWTLALSSRRAKTPAVFSINIMHRRGLWDGSEIAFWQFSVDFHLAVKIFRDAGDTRWLDFGNKVHQSNPGESRGDLEIIGRSFTRRFPRGWLVARRNIATATLKQTRENWREKHYRWFHTTSFHNSVGSLQRRSSWMFQWYIPCTQGFLYLIFLLCSIILTQSSTSWLKYCFLSIVDISQHNKEVIQSFFIYFDHHCRY